MRGYYLDWKVSEGKDNKLMYFDITLTNSGLKKKEIYSSQVELDYDKKTLTLLSEIPTTLPEEGLTEMFASLKVGFSMVNKFFFNHQVNYNLPETLCNMKLSSVLDVTYYECL